MSSEYNHLSCRVVNDDQGRVATELYCVETGKPIAGIISTQLNEAYNDATKIDIKMYLSDKNGHKFTCTHVGEE
jgi:hypothetical protein